MDFLFPGRGDAVAVDAVALGFGAGLVLGVDVFLFLNGVWFWFKGVLWQLILGLVCLALLLLCGW